MTTNKTTVTPLSSLVDQIKALPKMVKLGFIGVAILASSTYIDGFIQGYTRVSCTEVNPMFHIIKEPLLNMMVIKLQQEKGYSSLYSNGLVTGFDWKLSYCL